MKRLFLVGIIALGLSLPSFGQNNQGQNGNNNNGQNGNNQGQNGGHAPEVDPSQAVTALALLSGEILVIQGCRKK